MRLTVLIRKRLLFALQCTLVQRLAADAYALNANGLFHVEIEAKHISRIKPEAVKISDKLLLALGIIALAPPDLDLDDISLPR